MDDSVEALARTSDEMLETIEALKDIEVLKRQAPIGSPEFKVLVKRAEDLSRDVFRWSILQTTIAETATEGSDGVGISIEEVPRRSLHVVLADWREAQLRLIAAVPGSDEASPAATAADRAREQYMALEERARQKGS